jgi:hypothetical protein
MEVADREIGAGKELTGPPPSGIKVKFSRTLFEGGETHASG